MRTLVLTLAMLAVATSCQSSGPFSLGSQLNRRLGNIYRHLEPESIRRSFSRRVSNMGQTAGQMVQVRSRLRKLHEGVSGAVVGEWNRTTHLPNSVENFASVGINRFDRTVRKVTNPPHIWTHRWSPARILGRFEQAMLSLGTYLGLDRRILPMPGDPERRTDPNQPQGPTPTLWDRIFYRLRL